MSSYASALGCNVASPVSGACSPSLGRPPAGIGSNAGLARFKRHCYFYFYQVPSREEETLSEQQRSLLALRGPR